MEIIEIVNIIIPIWLVSQEWRIRNLNGRLVKAPGRSEVRELIQDKIQSLSATISALQESTARIEAKLDRLISSK